MKASFAIIVIVCFTLSMNLCQAAPSIVGAQAAQHQTALNLPEGCQLYVYGMTTGGGYQSSPFAEGQSVHVENASGVTSAEISVTATNNNSFTTDCGAYVIGGFGVTDFRYVQAFYEANRRPSANSASVQFTLVAPAMVAVLGMASSQQSLYFSGLPNLIVDVPHTTSAALAIAHTYLRPGTYTVQEKSAATADGQDPDHMVDLIGVLIFSDHPSTAKSDNPQIPLSLSPNKPSTPPVQSEPPTPSNGGENKPIGRYVILGVGVLVFIALAVAIIRMIIPRRGR